MQGRVLSELQGALDLSENRVRSRRRREKIMADGHRDGGVHTAGEPKGGREDFAPPSVGTGEPLQALEHKSGKIHLARDLRSLALRL